MYGLDYAASVVADPSIADPKAPERVLRFLRARQPGVFIDFGCGEGWLLAEAQQMKWRAIGIELDEDVARQVRERTGAMVTGLDGVGSFERSADVIHFGDVIEHLTDPDREFAQALRLLKPGGYLLAQGPLENNASMFTVFVRLSRSLRRGRRTEMAPYHVVLATSGGQKMLFGRFGLDEIEYSLEEVAWPAPDHLGLADLGRPRAVVLFTLRRASQLVTAIRPKTLGNRYFYVGRWNG
jgi:SAM-dependent methyltransferase